MYVYHVSGGGRNGGCVNGQATTSLETAALSRSVSLPVMYVMFLCAAVCIFHCVCVAALFKR